MTINFIYSTWSILRKKINLDYPKMALVFWLDFYETFWGMKGEDLCQKFQKVFFSYFYSFLPILSKSDLAFVSITMNINISELKSTKLKEIQKFFEIIHNVWVVFSSKTCGDVQLLLHSAFQFKTDLHSAARLDQYWEGKLNWEICWHFVLNLVFFCARSFYRVS